MPRAWSSPAGSPHGPETAGWSRSLPCHGAPRPPTALPEALRGTRGGRGRRPLWTGLVGSGITRRRFLGLFHSIMLGGGRSRGMRGARGHWAPRSSCRDTESRTKTVTDHHAHTGGRPSVCKDTPPRACTVPRPHASGTPPPAVSSFSPRPPPRCPGGTALGPSGRGAGVAGQVNGTVDVDSRSFL